MRTQSFSIFCTLFFYYNTFALLTAGIYVTDSDTLNTKVVTLSCTAPVSQGNSVSYSISTNQVITFKNVYDNIPTSTSITLTLNDGTIIPFLTNPNPSTGAGWLNSGNIYTGATNIALQTNPSQGTIQSAAITFTVYTPPTNSISITPVNSVVIPSDANGNVQIIMESSSDLVNWMPSLPGTYGSTYTNRFFRVRAVAQ